MSLPWFTKYPYQNDEILNLDWVLKKIQEFETSLNAWSVLAEELQAGLADINGMKEDISEIQSQISILDDLRTSIIYNAENISKLEDRVKALENQDIVVYVNEQLRLLRSQITTFQEQMINLLHSYEFRIDYEVQRLSDELDRRYQDLLDRINEIAPTEVFNRVAGVRLNLEDNNFNVYEDLRDLGMTNAEIASFGISNEYLASMVLNNRDFAINLKNRLHRFNIFSPLTGVRTTHENAISEVLYAILQGASNETLYNQMDSDGKTNDDLSDYINNNMGRYILSI